MTTKQKNGPLLLLLIAFYSFAAIGLPSGVLGVAWIHIQATFGLGLDALGALLTVTTMGRLITAFMSGRLMAQMGAGRYLLAGSILISAGLLGYVIAPAWAVLLAAGFMTGLGAGVLDAGVNTFIAPRYSASRLNWLHACFGVGLTVGPILVSWLVIDLGESWRLAYGVVMGFQVALVLMFLWTLQQWRLIPVKNAETETTSTPDASIRSTLRLTMMWLSLALFFTYGGVEIGMGQLLNSLLVEGRSVDPKLAASWVSFYWASFTIGRMLIGLFIDRVGPRLLLRISFGGVVAGSVLLWWNPAIIISFAGIAVVGFSLAAIFPTLLSVTPDRVGVEHTPNAIGFQIGFAGLGAATLVGLAGVLAENLDIEIISLFLVVVAFATLMVHEVILIREKRQILPSSS